MNYRKQALSPTITGWDEILLVFRRSDKLHTHRITVYANNIPQHSSVVRFALHIQWDRYQVVRNRAILCVESRLKGNGHSRDTHHGFLERTCPQCERLRHESLPLVSSPFPASWRDVLRTSVCTPLESGGLPRQLRERFGLPLNRESRLLGFPRSDYLR